MSAALEHIIGMAEEGTRLYVQPLGILSGSAAKQAMQDGIALPLQGHLAYTTARVTARKVSDTHSALVPAPVLRSIQHPALRIWLKRLSAIHPPLQGIPVDPPIVMGIVNVTPDSFSDGGQFLSIQAAIAHGLSMLEAGAHILDIGGESSRPNAEPVSIALEQDRVLPVIEGLAEVARQASAVISIDTRNAATMRAALNAGAHIINDVTALTHDPESLTVAAETGASVMLMHMQGTPQTMQDDPRYDDVALDVFDYLEERIAACEVAGIPRSRIVADYGIGFGKTVQHNLQLLASTSLFHGLGVPLLTGVSRKGFIGRLHRNALAQYRLPGSLAAGLEAIRQGAHILRVHDAAETAQALTVLRAVQDEA